MVPVSSVVKDWAVSTEPRLLPGISGSPFAPNRHFYCDGVLGPLVRTACL